MHAFKSFTPQKKFVCWKFYSMRKITCNSIYRQDKVDFFLWKTDLHLKRFYGFDVVITSRAFRLTFCPVPLAETHRRNKFTDWKKDGRSNNFFFTKSWFIPEAFVQFVLRLWLNCLVWWRSCHLGARRSRQK